MAAARPSGAATSPAPSSTGKEPVLLDLTPEEGIDQALGLPGEPGDHADPQTLGEGQEGAIEAAAQEHLHSRRREELEAPRPCLVRDGDPADLANLVPIQLSDHELVRRAEPGGHIGFVKRYGQHRPGILLEEVFAGRVPDRKPVQIKWVGVSSRNREGFMRRGVSGVEQHDSVCFRMS